MTLTDEDTNPILADDANRQCDNASDTTKGLGAERKARAIGRN